MNNEHTTRTMITVVFGLLLGVGVLLLVNWFNDSLPWPGQTGDQHDVNTRASQRLP